MITLARRLDIVELLKASAIWVEPDEQVTDCRDAKDNTCLELAFAANAVAIISGEADLLALDPWRHVRILTPAAFLAWIAAGGAIVSQPPR